MTDHAPLATQVMATAVLTLAWRTVEERGGTPSKIIRRREIYPGAGQAYLADRVDPVPALNAARALHLAAAEAERAAILDARSLGQGWDTIAGALGFYEFPEPELLGGTESAAWRYAALGVMPDEEPDWSALAKRPEEPAVRWHCDGCRVLVTETDPRHGPLAAETGHADGCPRRRAALDAKRLADEAAAAKVGTFVPERDGYLQADGSVNCAAACPMGCTGCAL